MAYSYNSSDNDNNNQQSTDLGSSSFGSSGRMGQDRAFDSQNPVSGQMGSGGDTYPRSGGGSSSYSGMSNTGGSRGDHSNDTATGMPKDSFNSGAQQGDGRPSIKDKIAGTIEEVEGKIKRDPLKQEQGVARRTEGRDGGAYGGGGNTSSDSWPNDSQGPQRQTEPGFIA